MLDIKLSQAQLSKLIQSGEFLPNMLGNLGKKVITDLAVPLDRDNLPGLVSNLASNAINGKEAVRAGKGFTLFVLKKAKTRTWLSSCSASTLGNFISAPSDFLSRKRY